MTNEQLAARRTLWDAYIKDHQPDGTVAHHLQRMLFAYTRYPEAESALSHLPRTGGHVLDFGCGVGDYGVSFARRGWKVTFCDVPEVLEFVRIDAGANLDRTDGVDHLDGHVQALFEGCGEA